MNCQNFSPKIQKFPGIAPGIFEVADSRECPGIPEWEFPVALLYYHTIFPDQLHAYQHFTAGERAPWLASPWRRHYI